MARRNVDTTAISVGGYDFSYYLQRSTAKPTKEQEYEAIAAAQRGDAAAWERLIFAYCRFVVKFAEGMLKVRPRHMPIEDAVQAGLLGFMAAVTRFDFSRNGRLTTYACDRMRQAIDREMVNYLPIRVPERYFNGTKDKNKTKYSDDAWRVLATVNESAIDPPMGHASYLASVPDRTPAEDVCERDDFERKTEAVRGWFSDSLRPRDREIVSRLFGLDTGKTQSLRDVGTDLGISKERVRQLQDAAMRRLRARAEA